MRLGIPDVPAGTVVQPASQHAAVTATATPAATRSGGGSGTWLFLVPVAGFAVIAFVVRRRARTA